MSLMSVEPPSPAENRFTESAPKLLPLESAALSVDVAGGLARVRLVQRFKNVHAESLSVSYKLPLPADAAVGGFAFRIGARRTHRHLRQEARETFERAVLEGRSAALLEQDRSSLFTQDGLVTIVPPSPDASVAKVPRDLTLLIDTSGSMSGEPLTQAKRVACALVDSLSLGDQLEMIECSSRSTGFEAAPRAVDAAFKKRAMAWIDGLSASGGTEMLSGVKHAMRELRAGSQGDFDHRRSASSGAARRANEAEFSQLSRGEPELLTRLGQLAASTHSLTAAGVALGKSCAVRRNWSHVNGWHGVRAAAGSWRRRHWGTRTADQMAERSSAIFQKRRCSINASRRIGQPSLSAPKRQAGCRNLWCVSLTHSWVA